MGYRQGGVALVLTLGWHSHAWAQACAEELRALQALQQRLRAEVIEGNTAAALATAHERKLETPVGYDFENSKTCQKWALEVASAHRASCSYDAARQQLEGLTTEQPHAIETLRAARERLTRTARVPYTCKDKKDLVLLCEPSSDTAPDAWCARRIGPEDSLEVPRTAWCKLVDEHGVEVSTVGEGYEPTCREEVQAQERAARSTLRTQRRGNVATAGTGIAILAAVAVPVSFIPQGITKFLGRVGVMDDRNVDRLRHRSSFTRQRVLPLLGVTALSLSALSSRFWWAGVLSAGCGISADVLLAQHWHQRDDTRRALGITAATLGAVSGLLLNIETLGRADAGPRRALMPTLSIGVARAEVGLAGRF